VTLGQELPRGGMSRVFESYDHTLHRKIAVKVLAPELAHAVSIERFRREIMVVAALQHPNIVPVLSAGEAGGLPYFVMPFIEGQSLRARLVRGPLSVREVVSIMRDVARALSLAHERGIVHRDVKPDNVMLTAGAATVTDFGVAKALDAAGVARRAADAGRQPDSAITNVGTALGTPAYMAPEQAAGEATIDHRADLYALGIVGYEMLTGAPPFHGRSLQQLMAAQLGATPVPIEARRSDVPAPLRTLIMQCLEKDPTQRPRSASAVVRALESPELTSAALEAPTPRSRLRRRARTRLAAAALLTVAIATLAYALWPARAASSPGDARATILIPAFRFLSPDSATYAAARVLAEQIVAGLSAVPELRVAGPPLADSLLLTQPGSGRRGDPPRLVLRGLVQHEGRTTRLTASLVDGAGYTIWGTTFEAQETQSFQLEDRLSAAVLAGLLPALRARLDIPQR
jgi:serine/threonine protein kinase